MKLTNIRRLKFSLPEAPFGTQLDTIKNLKDDLVSLTVKAGTENEKFKAAYSSLLRGVQRGQDLETELDASIKVRALALSLATPHADKISLTQRVLKKIDQLKPVPSSLLIQSMYQFYLQRYDKLGDYQAVGRWLLQNLPKRNLKEPFHDQLLGGNGPKWLAQDAIRTKREFQNQLAHLGLDRYASGRYMTVANNIYYVEQLNSIPVNQPHPLLFEVQKPSVYNAPYDEHRLLGHKVLETLIRRAANTRINDSWLNVVMAIAGDPRVPPSHPKYQKWWSQLDKQLHITVQRWLSKLDLRLFLEALQNFSDLPGKQTLHRMFPSRKSFLEGLDEKKLVTNTRLYLSSGAEKYLKMMYKDEHLPEYSRVKNGDKSLIYVELNHGQAHIVEGSHVCYLWIYKQLHDSAIVFNYANKMVSYDALTQGLNRDMERVGCPAVANITHNPNNFHWQRNAIQTLQRLGINISPEDVLSQADYKAFKRTVGIL